jgi:diamine N-acetyltransferase
MNLKGEKITLRAVEPEDVELMYAWENDPEVWHVSGTLAPFSRHALEQFAQNQSLDPFSAHQQRLIIETQAGEAIGTLDLFEIDPLNRRAGLGILIHRPENRGRGYAREALDLVVGYARNTLALEQLWCHIESDNEASRALFSGAGFRLAGCKKHWNWSPEGWKDEELWQRLFDEEKS